MDINKYKHYSLEDFVLDKDFTRWVLSPEQESDKFWNLFLQLYPEKKKHIQEASGFIKAIRVVEPPVPQHRLQEIYRNIIPLEKKVTRRGINQIYKYAAVLAILICFGGVIYLLTGNQEKLPVMIADKEVLEKGRIILPDGSINEFDNEISEIRQKASGELTLNDDTISLAGTSDNKSKTELAHIIIPYGKRSEITLSDGTRIWLNSGSQLSYPLSFSNDSRTVYLSGEAFFEVKADSSRKFHVITNDMKIEVTGTRFNITSYTTDHTTQAVLLDGKIAASKNKRFSKTLDLVPGERILYNKQSDEFLKDQVNVELYASWIDGYLIFENEQVGNIFKKLERYYNRSIVIEQLHGQPRFSGKLNLANNLEQVLENISFSASFSIEAENDKFIINP